MGMDDSRTHGSVDTEFEPRGVCRAIVYDVYEDWKMESFLF